MKMLDKAHWNRNIANSKIRFYCSDFAIENNPAGDIYKFLVNISNCTLSDPVFSGVHDGKPTRRTVQKNLATHEGQDFSSHVLIQLPSNDINSLDTAIMLIECSDGLGIVNIIKFFNSVLKQVKSSFPEKFQQLDPSGAIDDNGNSAYINVDYRFEYRIHPTRNVQDIINSSRIKEIQLVDERQTLTPLDGNSYFVENKKVLDISISDALNLNSNKWKWIQKFLPSKKADYQKAKIILSQDEGKPMKRIDLDLSGGLINALAESVYIRSDLDLESSYEHFCDPIISKMKELL